MVKVNRMRPKNLAHNSTVRLVSSRGIWWAGPETCMGNAHAVFNCRDEATGETRSRRELKLTFVRLLEIIRNIIRNTANTFRKRRERLDQLNFYDVFAPYIFPFSACTLLFIFHTPRP
jgi:hypothetical protein